VDKKRRGLGCLILFALPFAAGGLFVAFLAARSLVGWIEMRDWIPTPARIIHTDLEVGNGSDSTTYKVVARYEYEWQGTRFTGDRVSLHSGSDNVGSFHQNAYRELSNHRSSGEPFICFVNPGDPSESILYRNPRWGLLAFMVLFSTLFTGAGVGIIALGIWSLRKTEAQEALEEAHPNDPWLWKSEWQDGKIRATGKAQFVLPAVMATFWNLISAPLAFLIPKEVLENDNKLALIGLLFPIVGIGLAVWAIRAFIRWKRFGDSVFEMAAVPGVIGGKLIGRIVTSVDLKPAEGFHLTLSCINRVTTGSGDDRRTTERVLWQDVRHLLREPLDWDPTKSEIPVLFAIPYDMSPTEERNDDNEVLWRLVLTADVPGVDYAAQFEVPVFKTIESREDYELEENPYEELEAPSDPQKALADDHIIEDILPEGHRRFVFPAARHKGAALGLTFFFLIWSGFTWLLFELDAPILFPIVFGLFELLIILGVLTLWFEKRSIEVRAEELVLRGGMLGVGRTRTVPRTLITEIRPVRGMQSGNKLFYQIKVETQDGKSHLAANRIGNLSLARQIIESMS
jgi:hypothetical protein